MKKIFCIISALLLLFAFSSCSNKNAREREIKQQQIDQANENLQRIDEIEKQHDSIKDLLKDY